MTDKCFSGNYHVGFRTWCSDGINPFYGFENQRLIKIKLLHLGSGPFQFKNDPCPFGNEIAFEIHDNELCLIDIPPYGAYFTAWYEYEPKTV